MTREIKFRAWDEEKREMFEVSGMRWKDGMVTGDDTWYGDDFLAPALRISSTLMQYTGLKDKNGKEIYEGDILKGTESTDGYGNYLTYRGVVSYSDEKGAWVVIDDDDTWHLYDYAFEEVIGNVYENPNLLKND